MKRKEEIEKAADLYSDQPESCLEYSDDGWEDKSDWEYVEKAFIAGARWADEHPIHYDGKAYLYVLHKGVEQGKREMLDKVCDFIKENIDHYIGFYLNDGDTYLDDSFFEHLKKAMEDKE